MTKISKNIIFYLTIVLILFTAYVAYHQKKSRAHDYPALSATITPIPVPINGVLSMDSPDGSKTLTLESQKLTETTSYTLSVLTKADGMHQLIFNSDTYFSQKFEIPFNTWSPDNQYIFLKEIRPNAVNYYVFQSSGDVFWDGASLLSVQDLFSNQVSHYFIENVTGWAAPNLLVVNAKSTEGDQRVSFWLDVPSQTFIQLGTYFK
ncbi:hypothetical protein COY90_03855 [Candidatus Roizmanbacteria bacterium CG_4_10_14_0_8_um_filter_39_9]|uniref:Uncharacterized protein n=1 Tax=Candidatus Roizmanbacteria bacterium CG_4_10_14_0_8_um_filter_39_9 TaxID=1974829 RepID=A0A2M7QDA1_9BACT|nr:MAG: hypothetical protein COY90_03855 [Candidatus Roizmanbacteria bacterium CG_4_10_14_0_8_um_filter_39_9]